MKSLKNRMNESLNEASTTHYLLGLDSDEKEFEYSTFDKAQIKKDLTDYLGKNKDDELWLYKVSNATKTVGDDYIDAYVWHKGKVAKEVQKGNKTFYKSFDENLNEAQDFNIEIDLATKDVEKAKKVLSKVFSIKSVNELNKQQSNIELDEKASKEGYAKLKKAMGSIKWEHSLPF